MQEPLGRYVAWVFWDSVLELELFCVWSWCYAIYSTNHVFPTVLLFGLFLLLQIDFGMPQFISNSGANAKLIAMLWCNLLQLYIEYEALAILTCTYTHTRKLKLTQGAKLNQWEQVFRMPYINWRLCDAYSTFSVWALSLWQKTWPELKIENKMTFWNPKWARM